jgi:phosphate transport system ATP-binding protein
MNPLIQVENLHLYYGEFHALKGLNLPIEEKSITAFIGPSGCGKSTLLRSFNRMNDMIAGVKTKGTIFVGGVDIYSPEVDVETLRKRIGMVFQQPNPFPKSVYDNIAYGPRIHGIKQKAALDEIVEKSLRQAALWGEVKDHLNRSAFGLSGGQQQRLCIARALAVNPDILLMDEATASLDPISTLKIEELVHELRESYTIVMVTHNMQQAARVSSHTAFFLNGEIIEHAKTDDLFSNPREQRTEDYISGRFG